MAYITIAELRDYLDLHDTDTYTPAFAADTLTLASVQFRNTLKTGTEVTVSSNTDDPPAPLVEGTVYYVIEGADQLIQLAATSALATAGTEIVLTDNGTGIHTIIREDADTSVLYDAISAAEMYIESQTNRQFSKSMGYTAYAGADTLVLVDVDIRDLFTTGTPVTVSSSLRDPPAPLVEGTVYYTIEISDTLIQLASTEALALAGTEIDLTDNGTGTHTITRLDAHHSMRDALDPWNSTLLHVNGDLLTVNALTNGDSDATAIASTDFWLVPFNMGPPYYGIQLKRNEGIYWEFDTDYRVTVIGTWGYSTTPPRDIKQACLVLAAYFFQQRSSQVFDTTAIPDAGVITIPSGIPATVTKVIERYKRYL